MLTTVYLVTAISTIIVSVTNVLLCETLSVTALEFMGPFTLCGWKIYTRESDKLTKTAHMYLFIAYSRTTGLVLSTILSVYGRRKPATPVVLSVAVNLRALASTDNQWWVSRLRTSVDYASHYHHLRNVTLADINAGTREAARFEFGTFTTWVWGSLPTALLRPPTGPQACI